MTALISIRGELLPVGKLVSHYRFMARTDRKSASFWRTRARTVIREYREQQSGENSIAA